MKQVQTIEEALHSLGDLTQNATIREQALHTLAKDPSPDHLHYLIEALDDDLFGVRWEAAVVLADLGDVALKPVLHALVEHHASTWIREGVHHVLYYSRSSAVREHTRALQQALRGPAAEVTAASEAVKLLQTG